MAPILVSVPWGSIVPYYGPREASAVLRAAAPADAVPAMGMQLLVGGKLLRGSDRVPASCLNATVVLSGLRGGKGGFGAMLRAMGKAGGAKATTNFGACRDLYGRRLRHVNDEIRLKKWQEYQEAKRDAHGRGDKEALAKLENPEEATETGIRGWNLEIPKWADGVHKLGKANTMKRMRRMRRQARRGGAAGGAGQSAADGAAARRVGDGHKFNTLSRDDYVAGAAAPESEDAVADAVKEGIAASNAAKRRRLEQEGASEERFLPLQEGGVSGVPTLRWDEDSWLLAMAGDLVVQEGAVLEGLSEFGSARVAAVALTSGQWYYEVTVLTDGLLQIGWADQSFEAQEEADGVGDHPRSWAYDGARGRRWNGEAEGRAYGEQWSRGDVVGCMLDADAGAMRFWLNGKDLGVAFTGVDCSVNGGLFPAISLEQGESAEVNLGQRPFAYPSAPGAGARALWTHAALQSHFARAAAAGEASAAAPGLGGRGLRPLASNEPRGEGSVNVEDQGSGDSKDGPGTGVGEERLSDDEPLDLDRYPTAQALEALGLEALKRELARRGLKCGGSLQERADRLDRVRGLSEEAIPASLRARGGKRGKRKSARATAQTE